MELFRTAIKHHKTFLLRSKQQAKSSVASLCTNKKITLHEAVKKDLKDVAVQLLKNGTSVNVRESETFRTPLHYVTSKSLAQLLIEQGAEVNAQDKNGDTPLHMAHADAIPTLLMHDADISIKNKRYEKIWMRTVAWPYSLGAEIDIKKLSEIITRYQEQSFEVDVDCDHGTSVIYLAINGIRPLMKTCWAPNKLKRYIDHANPEKLSQELKPIKVIIEAYKLYHPDLFVPNLKNIERLSIDHLIKEFEEKTQ